MLSLWVFKKMLNLSESPVKESIWAFWNVNLHFFKIFAACIFFEVEQERIINTSPRQITNFATMPEFFAKKVPELRIQAEFTNFVAAILLFAGLAMAAVNINTAENAEIAAFIESESKKILQVPDSLVLNLNFQTAKDKHSRAGILFFIGEREVSIKAEYTMDLPAGQFKGTFLADTSWFTGYCGMVECRTKPMPAEQRIDTLKALVLKILAELNSRMRGLKVSPVAAVVDTTAAADTTVAPAAAATDTTAAADTTAAPAVADTAVAADRDSVQ